MFCGCCIIWSSLVSVIFKGTIFWKPAHATIHEAPVIRLSKCFREKIFSRSILGVLDRFSRAIDNLYLTPCSHHRIMAFPSIASVRAAVSTYLGVPIPHIPITILGDVEFNRAYSTTSDRLFGGIGAITLPSREIVLPRSRKANVIHELVHIAFQHEAGVSEPINEGVTQVAAEEVARLMNVRCPKTYADEVKYVRTRIIPATRMDLRTFLRGYARAQDKGKYIASRIWKNQKRYFSDPGDWGSPMRVQADLERAIRFGLGRSDIYTEYLYDIRAL